MRSPLAIQLCVVSVLVRQHLITARQVEAFVRDGFTHPVIPLRGDALEEVFIACNDISTALAQFPHAVNGADVMTRLKSHASDGRLRAEDVEAFVARARAK